ncbi:MAG: peroxiredoxin [Nitrososphaerota archaeon]|nr:peroxiredoxin [Nitrososphaerota archaeon]
MALKVGDSIPDLTLYDQSRKPRKLSEFTTSPTVLAFFPGAFTSVCTKEMCTFRDMLSNLAPLGKVVGISVDSPFSLSAFAQSNGITFPLLSDYDRKACRAFGVEFQNFVDMPGYTVAHRSIFVVGNDGKIKYAWLAPNQGVEPNYSEVQEELKKAKGP